MSPFLQRKLRQMSTVLAVILSLGVAGVCAWMVRRRETAGEARPTPCSRLLDEVFANGAVNTPDSLLLARLLQHRAACTGDAAYVDQLRRLLLNAEQVHEARALLRDAERLGTFKPDELEAEHAWVDLAEAQLASTKGMEAGATELRGRATTTANELRARWPEWSLPYRILEEAERANGASSASPVADYFQLERTARSRLLNGAYVRSLSDWQPIAFVFVAVAMAMLGLCAGVSGVLSTHELTRIAMSPIAEALPGYVKVAGTLHVPPNGSAVIGPSSKTPAVWYELASKSGFKDSRMSYERSAQPFLLRDASGEAVIEPKGMTVRTRHTATKFGSSGGASSSKQDTERLLGENDSVVVLGQLIVTTAPNGTRLRSIRTADDGRPLLVSNLSEKQLLSIARLWSWIGASVFLLMVVLLAWSFYQRYQVSAVPAILL